MTSLLADVSHLRPGLAPLRERWCCLDLYSTIGVNALRPNPFISAEATLPTPDSSHDAPGHCRRQHQHDGRFQENLAGARQHCVRPPLHTRLHRKPNDVRGVVGGVAHHKHSEGGERDFQDLPLLHEGQVGAPHKSNSAQCAERGHDQGQEKQHDGHLQTQRQQNGQLRGVEVVVAR